MAEKIVKPGTYLIIFIALLVLTAVTTLVALVDLGRLNTVVALTIAVTKMLLVALFFMHVKYSSRLTWIVVGGGLLWLAIMVTFTLSDFLTRTWIWRTS